MQLYTNSIQDRYGNALKGAQITVRTEAGELAALYSDNGVTLATNPLATDASGEFRFYAANGRYTFGVSALGMRPEVVQPFEMYDALELRDLAVADAAAAAAAVVGHIYPGTYASDPLIRPDGSARQAGDTAFISGLNRQWTGAIWQASDINTANLAAPGGAELVATVAQGVGAVSRTVAARLEELPLSPLMFGGVYDPLADNTLALQKALAAAALRANKTVHALGMPWLCDTVTVPVGVTFICNLQMKTSNTDLVKVNADSRVIGKLRGRGAVGTVERLIVPAGDDCHDVYLDVDVSNASYGVHATHITDIAKAPRRWSGSIRAKDMSGDGTQRGYGLLCSPAHDFNMQVSGVNIPRHSLYLSNGASNNNVTVHSDTAGYGDVQIASLDGQDACTLNKITVHARNMQSPAGNDSFACNLVGNVTRNKITVFVKDSPMASGAALLRSLSNASVCRGNDVEVYQDGAVGGLAVVLSQAGLENTVSITGKGGSTFGASSACVSVANYLGIVPTDPGRFALRIKKLDYSASGNAMRGVSVAASYAQTDIGQGVVNYRDYGASSVIVDNTGAPSKIQGWVTEYAFDETRTLAAGGSGEIVLAFPSMPLKREITYSMIMPTGGPAKVPQAFVTGLSATAATVAILQNGASAGDLTLRGRVRGY